MVLLPSLAGLTSFVAFASLAAAAGSAQSGVQGRHAGMHIERRASTSPSPTSPGPNDVFKTGDQCTIQWTEGSGSKWKSMTIDLMTGANKAMQKITNVASDIDGTSVSQYSWTCPDVTPNAPIYFYQLTDKSGGNPTWTTRFTIASADGQTVAAPNANQPEGDAIPWGTGALVNGGSSSSSTNSASNASSSSSASSSSNQQASSNNSSSSTNASQTGSSSSSSGGSTSNTTSQASTTKSSGALSLSVQGAFAGVMAAAVGALLL